ncbi:hypothetical protein DFP72DRAFT_931946 [Ephemerocybe angulata]|uniref:F-box domain-containing protein n=1 Tax=Ephemerocybe angulata TaxID=980116 RepID=A0A8H6HCI3_9AGAR|nr:hypothetical protein DFP72DRAFT_931946 [Tulosesus angulatus]
MAPVDLSRVLWTNDAPTLAEETSLKKAVSKLERKLMIIQRNLDQHRGALSVIRRFPYEVLGRIFCFALDTPSPLDRYHRSVLLKLGRVCRGWREASLLEHRLWSRLELGSEGTYDQVTTWLSRSGNVAKSLRTTMWKKEDDDIFANSTIVRLLTDGPPFDHLCLSCGHVGALAQFIYHFGLARVGAPLRPWDGLRSLVIDICYEPSSASAFDGATPPSTIYSLLPPVKSLVICLPSQEFTFGARIPHDVPIGVTPTLLAGLTSLAFSCDWKSDHILSMLQQCTNLEHLIVEFNNLVVLDPNQLGRTYPLDGIHLTKLRSLELRWLRRPTQQLRILRHIITPYLTSLTIFAEMDENATLSQGGTRAIKRFIKRSRCQDTLCSLQLQRIDPEDPEDFASIFTSMPGLTRLSLRQVTVDEDFWRSLRKGKCLPDLEELEVLEVTDVEDSWGFIRELLRFLEAQGKRDKKREVLVSFPKPRSFTTSDAEYIWASRKRGSLKDFAIEFGMIRKAIEYDMSDPWNF